MDPNQSTCPSQGELNENTFRPIMVNGTHVPHGNPSGNTDEAASRTVLENTHNRNLPATPPHQTAVAEEETETNGTQTFSNVQKGPAAEVERDTEIATTHSRRNPIGAARQGIEHPHIEIHNGPELVARGEKGNGPSFTSNGIVAGQSIDDTSTRNTYGLASAAQRTVANPQPHVQTQLQSIQQYQAHLQSLFNPQSQPQLVDDSQNDPGPSDDSHDSLLQSLFGDRSGNEETFASHAEEEPEALEHPVEARSSVEERNQDLNQDDRRLIQALGEYLRAKDVSAFANRQNSQIQPRERTPPVDIPGYVDPLGLSLNLGQHPSNVGTSPMQAQRNLGSFSNPFGLLSLPTDVENRAIGGRGMRQDNGQPASDYTGLDNANRRVRLAPRGPYPLPFPPRPRAPQGRSAQQAGELEFTHWTPRGFQSIPDNLSTGPAGLDNPPSAPPRPLRRPGNPRESSVTPTGQPREVEQRERGAGQDNEEGKEEEGRRQGQKRKGSWGRVQKDPSELKPRRHTTLEDFPAYPRRGRKIPRDVHGEELVRRFPNHVRGERLLELLSSNWTFTRIIDSMPIVDSQRRYRLMLALNQRRQLAINERDRVGTPVPVELRASAAGDLARFKKEAAETSGSSSSNPPPPPAPSTSPPQAPEVSNPEGEASKQKEKGEEEDAEAASGR